MLADESLDIIRSIKLHLEKHDPGFETAPPIIVAPPSWVREIEKHFGKENGTEVLDEIHGIKVREDEAVTEPSLVTGRGNVYSVIPDWAKTTPAQPPSQA